MLKIRDGVDLKELEKFGLIKIENCNRLGVGEIQLDGDDGPGWVDIDGFKIRKKDYWSTCFEIETLYDLIKADLVEKVDD